MTCPPARIASMKIYEYKANPLADEVIKDQMACLPACVALISSYEGCLLALLQRARMAGR